MNRPLTTATYASPFRSLGDCRLDCVKPQNFKSRFEQVFEYVRLDQGGQSPSDANKFLHDLQLGLGRASYEIKSDVVIAHSGLKTNYRIGTLPEKVASLVYGKMSEGREVVLVLADVEVRKDDQSQMAFVFNIFSEKNETD